MWECFVKDPNFLSGLYEANASGRNKQLSLQGAVVWDDFHLRPPRVCKLTNAGLQGGDPSSIWVSDHVGAWATYLGYALLGRGELTAKALDFACHDRWKLFERIAGFSQLVLPGGELLVQRILLLLLSEGSQFSLREFQR